MSGELAPQTSVTDAGMMRGPDSIPGERLAVEHGAIVRGGVEGELEVKLQEGCTARATYTLLAVALYDGGHYVIEMREGESWLRVDGMQHGGVGQLCPPPDYGREASDWYPVCVVYDKVV